MGFLLNIFYLGAILLAFPWLLYQRLRHGKYRDGWAAKFLGQVPERNGDRPCIWVHAVSVGEVNLLESILKRWERLHPDWDCVISTTTQTGYQLACKKYGPRTVLYCPLDFTWSVRRAMQRIRPTLLVLAELELWPNLVFAAKQHGAKVAVINGRLGEKSFRGYRRIAWLAQTILSELDLIAAQNDDYLNRFLALGAPPSIVHSTGSIKFDGAWTNRSSTEVQRLAHLGGISPEDIVFLAGSTQDPEESVALSVFQRLAAEFPRLRLILVPRHPERFDDVAALLDRSGLPWDRRSRVSVNSQPPTSGSRVLLVDAVGELGHWWGTAKIAFVGGSLTSRGGQNMIEPAAYGAAVSFGPNTWNFQDVVSLMLEHRAAVVVRDEEQVEAFVRRCLIDPGFADQLGQKAQELVGRQQGAADRTIEMIEQLVIRKSKIGLADRAA
jgi:3-deoxy-D-manno-octulosonic-acid transferase